MEKTEQDQPERKTTDRDVVHVTVYNEDDGDTYHFEAKLEEQLATMIAELYKDKLRRQRQPDDRLRCDSNGEDVFQFETLTFERYLAEGHCPELKWLFSGGTGGA